MGDGLPHDRLAQPRHKAVACGIFAVRRNISRTTGQRQPIFSVLTRRHQPNVVVMVLQLTKTTSENWKSRTHAHSSLSNPQEAKAYRRKRPLSLSESTGAAATAASH